MWSLRHHRLGLAIVLVLLFGIAAPVGADESKVVGQATFSDYPEVLDVVPWDVWAVKVSASEPDNGVLEMWNPYNDWNFVKNMDPTPLGLPADTDMKEFSKSLREVIGEIWMKVDIACVNIVDNRAIVGGQITKAGDVFVDAGLLDTWIGIEFFDMAADPNVDDFTESVHSDFPENPDEPVVIVTEEDVLHWCDIGDVPVPDDWFYYQTVLVSGDIEVRG